MELLQLEVQGLLQDALAPRTSLSYQRAWHLFRLFSSRHGFDADQCPTLQQLVQFIAFLSVSGYAPATITSYVSGIASQLQLLSFPDVTKHFVVKRLLEGCRRRNTRRDRRRPITHDILCRIIPALQAVCSNHFEARLFRVAFLLAFYGFLRIGELTASARHLPSPLSRSDVNVREAPLRVELVLRHSKTDQHGHGYVLSIPALENGNALLCPVQATLNYLASCTVPHTSFLSHYDGSPLTRYQFTAVLRRALDFVGLNDDRFTSHSFRIGAATSAAMAGVAEDSIKVMGRWKSGAYRRYIRISPNIFGL